MSRFIVRLMKQVCGDNGFEVDACQHTVEVDARNDAEAAKIAKMDFCEKARLSEWTDRADSVRVEPADFPS